MIVWKCGRRMSSCEKLSTMKRVFRWLAGILIGLIVLLLVALLLKDAAIRSFAERRILSRTGLTVSIGSLKIGLMSATVAMTDFKAFNPPGFGNATLLDVPDAECILDTRQARTNRLHFNELKLRLGEFNLIKNKDGLLNLESVRATILRHAFRNPNFKFTFGGIDRLEVGLERVNYIDQQHPTNNVRLELAAQSGVVTNLQTEGAFNQWLNGFLIRIAFEQYLKNPNVTGEGWNFLRDAARRTGAPTEKDAVKGEL